MTKSYAWLRNILVCGITILVSTPALSQITPDNTLGAENSRLTPNVTINGAGADRIDGGATRGSNLFHSFSDFNINDGQRVYFGNPTGIQNILTRVTGGNASNILGTLGVDGGANLFLINPNGIIFGQNASLDLRGSFVGTTANAIGFGEQGFFSATDPNSPPLLTVQPSALLYTQLNGGSIVSKSIAPAGTSPTGRNLFGLRVPDGQSLQLVGGDVEIDGGGIGAGLIAQGGRIELGGLAQTGAIALDNGQLTYPDNLAPGNVSLVNGARVSVRGNGGGDVVVNANDFTATNGGRLVAGTEKTGNAGDITVNANTINFVGVASDGAESGLFNEVLPNAIGNGGNIKVNTNSLNASSGAEISASTSGIGDAGSVLVQALDSVSAAGNSYIRSNVESGAKGNGGNINLTTGSLSLTDGAQIDASTYGTGDAGNVTINASDISFRGVNPKVTTGVVSNVEGGAKGNGGDINITAATLSLSDIAQVQTLVREASQSLPAGEGIAGNVFVDVSGNVTISGVKDGFSSGIFSSLGGGAKGKGGNINLKTGSLSLTDGAQISTSTSGIGDAGSVLVQALDSVSAAGNSYIRSNVESGAKGNGGNINLTTGLFSLTNGAGISASTYGIGDAGNITIDAPTAVTFDSISGAVSGVDKEGVGKGGNIFVTTGTLRLTNGSILTTISEGQGDAGNIVVNARDTVSLDSNSIVGTPIGSSDGSPTKGQSGAIEINARSLFITNGGGLLSVTNGQGDAGKIDIRATDSVVIDGGSSNNFTGIASTVLTNAVGKGGDIQITTDSLSLANNASLVAATNGQGDSGNVMINARDRVSFSSGAGLFTNTIGQGNAGNVTIRTGDLSIDGVSQDGNSRSRISSDVVQTGVGRAGNIDITADSFAVTNGGVISATTEGQGKAGDLTIKAGSRVSLSGTSPNGQYRSAITTETTNTSKEDAGNLTIATKRLSISDGAIISAATFGQGKAGDITINASDSISLSGRTPDNQYPSAITTETTNSATGNAGNLNIATSLFDIRDGAGIFAATFGQGRAGDVTVQADSLRLNRGQISTQTASTNGGNISLKLDDTLILRNNSLISTDAGTAQAGGDGGNITINTPFIIALPNGNSDITANAYSGRGGNVNIDDAQSIFGIQKRAKASPQTNDITATSELGVPGQINITEPNVQPTQGLVELPAQVLDASDQIAQTCPSGANAKRPLGEFVVTGRGGSLPPNPIEPLAGSTSLSPLASIDGVSQTNISSHSSYPVSTATPQTIVEAQGWVKTPDGKIALVANAPQATPVATTTQATCQLAK